MSTGIGCVSAGIAVLLASGLAADAWAQKAPTLGAADRTAVFKAFGAVQRGGKWVACPDDPYGGAAGIGEVRDLNGDGRLEVVVTGDGTFCYGHAGTGYGLLSKQANGSWKLIDGGSGIPEFLKTKGKDGWPDVSVGGPGFCFPVLRWNGREYDVHRHEYEGKACKANQ